MILEVKHGMHEDTGDDMGSVPEDKSYFGPWLQSAVWAGCADAAALHMTVAQTTENT
jgi:hypothetical protein